MTEEMDDHEERAGYDWVSTVLMLSHMDSLIKILLFVFVFTVYGFLVARPQPGTHCITSHLLT